MPAETRYYVDVRQPDFHPEWTPLTYVLDRADLANVFVPAGWIARWRVAEYFDLRPDFQVVDSHLLPMPS